MVEGEDEEDEKAYTLSLHNVIPLHVNYSFCCLSFFFFLQRIVIG